MKLHSWGRYPTLTAHQKSPIDIHGIQALLNKGNTLITRGLGRSYGDSALASHVINTRNLNHFIHFDAESGVLSCEAGVSLDDILRICVPKGWFLPVTPGTRYVTVGGAIASDVHGKNHHHAGTFGQHVCEMKILLGNGVVVTASPTHHQDLFQATCGGMGLTGIILSATIRLIPISSSNIVQTTLKTSCLEDTVEQLSQHQDSTYSVAWFDSLAKGQNLGRGLVMLGEHANTGSCLLKQGSRCTVPSFSPTLVHPWTIKAFNQLYYQLGRNPDKKNIPCDKFFYPLDSIQHWNRLYGRKGFLQYQCVIPKEAGVKALRTIIKHCSDVGMGAFLAVLKMLGPANDHLLSFPMEGYTVALDFKHAPGLFAFLDTLDSHLLDYGGRVYLTKDARLSEETFKQSYPHWETFETIRAKYHAIGQFASQQSKRLGLE